MKDDFISACAMKTLADNKIKEQEEEFFLKYKDELMSEIKRAASQGCYSICFKVDYQFHARPLCAALSRYGFFAYPDITITHSTGYIEQSITVSWKGAYNESWR